MPTTTELTRDWARRGASARLAELDAERSLILKQFPELRNGADWRSGRRRKKLTAAARAKLSAGMRKYWARRKAQAKNK